MSIEVKVTQIEPDGDIVKVIHGYEVPVILVLVDGQRYKDRIHRRLLRDAKGFQRSLPKDPDEPTWALFNDDSGKFQGLKRRFRIGGER